MVNDHDKFDSTFRTTVGIPLSKFAAHVLTLSSECDRFLLELESDQQTVRSCCANSELTLDLDAFKDDPEYLIRKAFPLENERIVNRSEKVDFLLAHFFMCHFVLRDIIVPSVKETAETLRARIEAVKEPFSWAQVDELKTSLEQLDRLWAYCANLLDVWEEYEIYLGES